jgi:hypothetical protein
MSYAFGSRPRTVSSRCDAVVSVTMPQLDRVRTIASRPCRRSCFFGRIVVEPLVARRNWSANENEVLSRR